MLRCSLELQTITDLYCVGSGVWMLSMLRSLVG
jgi:hypothetical protein